VRLLGEVFDHGLVDAGHGDFERGFEAETTAIFTRADADRRGDLGVVRDLYLFLAGDELQRAEEAGGITDREELFRVRAGRAVAAELLRNGERDVDGAVFGGAVAGAATGGGCFGSVENGHGMVPSWLSSLMMETR
jgi:hypothetical protein